MIEYEAFEVRTCDKKESVKSNFQECFEKRKQEIMKKELVEVGWFQKWACQQGIL